jgi:crotonobetainyl-CoA:carnitine CoA-transferase CaiB-like acyl-CoA transferase
LVQQLAGVRVLDLGIWRPVPYATQLLAELGAEVTKVEPPGGDPMRVFGSLYRTLNGAKGVIELDLKSDAGRERLAEMIRDADVVIEGFRPGVAKRLGAGFDDAIALNPRVVYCSISGFGQDGPLASAPGHDLNYQAWSGVLAERAPEVHVAGIPVGDLAGGAFAAMAICAALARRGLVGIDQFEGERIDVSMADTLVTWAGPDAGGELTEGESADANLPGYGTFACRDGWLSLGIVTEDPFWRALCVALGLDDLADHDLEARVEKGAALRERVEAALADRDRDEVVADLLVAGVPVAPVLSRTEAIAHEHFTARGTVVDGAIGHPVRFGRGPEPA